MASIRDLLKLAVTDGVWNAIGSYAQERAASEPGPPKINQFSVSGPAYRDWNVDNAILEGLKSHWVVYRCLQLRARAFMSVPWRAVERTGDDELVDLSRDHPASKFLRTPNPYQRWEELMYRASIHLDLAGDTFFFHFPVDGVSGERGIYDLKPQRVTVKPVAPFEARYIYDTGDGNPVTYEQEEVLQVSTYDPSNDFLGLALLRAAGKVVDSSNSMQDSQKHSIENAILPSGIISGEMSKPKKEEIEAQLTAKHSGGKNHRKMLIARSSIEYQPLILTPAEVDYIQSIEGTNRAICVTFGVDPCLLGLYDVKYENKHQAEVFMWRHDVIPGLRHMNGRLNTIAHLFGENIEFAYDLSTTPAMVEARREAAEEAKTYFGMGFAPRVINQKIGMGFDPEDCLPYGVLPATVVPVEAEETPSRSILTPPERSLAWLDLPNQRAIDRFWRATDTQKRRFEEAIAKAIRSRFSEESSVILQAFQDGERDLDAEIEAGEREWKEVIRASVLGVAGHFGREVFDSIAERADTRKTRNTEYEVFNAQALAWIEAYVADEVRKIQTFTKREVRRVIAAAFESGASAGEAAAVLQGKYRRWMGRKSDLGFERSRSYVIARTETHTAAGYGQHAGAEATGANLDKIWVTAGDGRERKSHEKMNGQKRGFHEAYSNGAQYPGDPAAGPNEIIQCRCSQYFKKRGR